MTASTRQKIARVRRAAALEAPERPRAAAELPLPASAVARQTLFDDSILRDDDGDVPVFRARIPSPPAARRAPRVERVRLQ